MSVVGDYEYVKPGSMEKSTQKLSLKADGSAVYSEKGTTGMEDFSSEGTGKEDLKQVNDLSHPL